MNTKRRVLSFLMALVMVLGVMAILPMTVSAAFSTSINITQVGDKMVELDTAGTFTTKHNSWKAITLSELAATAPTVNGQIGASEYQTDRESYLTALNHQPYASNGHEYYAQDKDNVYLGFELPGYMEGGDVKLLLWGHDDTALTENYIDLWHATPIKGTYMILNIASDGTVTVEENKPTGAWGNSVVNWTTTSAAITRDAGAGKGYFEIKLPKNDLSLTFHQIYAESTRANIRYICRYETAADTYQNFGVGIPTSKTHAIHSTIFGYTSSSGNTNAFIFPKTVNYTATPANEFKAYRTEKFGTNDIRRLMELAEDFDANDLHANRYESDFASIELNTFVKAAPALDGAVTAEEYGNLSRNVIEHGGSALGSNGVGLSSGVIKCIGTAVDSADAAPSAYEYFAQDEENIYLAFKVTYDGTTDITLRINANSAMALQGNKFQNAGKTIVLKAADGTVTAAGWVGVADASALVAHSTLEAGTLTLEYKLPKQVLVDTFGLDDVYALTSVRYGLGYGKNLMAGFRRNSALMAAAVNVALVGEKWTNWNTFLKNINVSTPDMYSANVGSVRIDTAETSGLRFQTSVSKAYLAELEAEGYTVKAGTLIAPEDFNIAKHTDGTVNEDYIDVVANLEYPYDTDSKYITFTGSIVKINPGNRDRDFTAIGYLALTKGGNTEYVYSNAVTKNVSEIAQAAIDSGKYNEDPDALEILNGLLAN